MSDWDDAKFYGNVWKQKLGGRRPRILIVEDEKDVSLVLDLLFKKVGAEVTSALDINTALMALQTDSFDLTCVNLKLPRGIGDAPTTSSGISFLKWCRANKPHMQTPIITGFETDSPEITEARREVNPFPPVFNKPFDIGGVVALLRSSGLPVNYAEGESRTLST